MSASSQWRCCADPTTWRYEPSWQLRRGARGDVGRDMLLEQRLQAFDDRATATGTDRATVDGVDGDEAGEGAGHECFVRGVDVGQAERRFLGGDACIATHPENVAASDAAQAEAAVRGQHFGLAVDR